MFIRPRADGHLGGFHFLAPASAHSRASFLWAWGSLLVGLLLGTCLTGEELQGHVLSPCFNLLINCLAW